MRYIVSKVDDFSSLFIDNFFDYIYDYKKNKIKNYVFSRKRQSIVGEILLSKLLLECGINYSDACFSINCNGKPYISNYDIFFNISHSFDYVICVLSDHEVGVDIQKIKGSIDVYDFCKKESFVKMEGSSILEFDGFSDCSFTFIDSIPGYFISICEKN